MIALLSAIFVLAQGVYRFILGPITEQWTEEIWRGIR